VEGKMMFRRRKLVDALMRVLAALFAAFGVVLLFLIFLDIVLNGYRAINLDFFTQLPRPYGEEGGGVAQAIVGSLYLLALASLIGIPVGVGTAIYLAEFGRGTLARAVRFSADMIAGLPSIVVGVFVWAFMVRHIVGQYAGIAGAVALAIIMIPIIARTVEEILRLVPDSLREAALALGIPKWKTILRVVLPTASSGIATGVLLSVARAGGETAPLLLTTLGNQFFNFNLLEPVAALPVQIYTYAVGPYEDWHIKAWGASLLLVGIIALLSLATRYATRKRRFV
jgi:phosphate transport system permease protein